MAGYTDYLNLYFKNPRTDGSDTFNIQTMMNDNWEKIDAFASKAGLPDAGKGLVYIKCTDSSGNPLYGCAVQIDGAASVSSSDGYVRFSIPSGTYSAIVYGPIDYGMEEKVLSVTAYDGKTSEFSVVINDISNGAKKIIITESCVCAFSKRVVSADAFGVGAGGSGGAASRDFAAASGGAGGETATTENVNVGLLFSIDIGAGGSPVTAPVNVSSSNVYSIDGNSGGDTVITAGNATVLIAHGGEGGNADDAITINAQAAGAAGGSGSGGADGWRESSVGASGSNGADGAAVGLVAGGTGQGKTTSSFGEASVGENYSSAGGGAAASANAIAVGTAGTGAGEGDAGESGANAGAASTPGSGGGAAAARSGSAISGAGADGLVIFRWEVAS